jgi:hypothetical protein
MTRLVLVVLAVAAPLVAHAGSDGKVPMREAIQACQSHLKDADGFDNRRSYSFGDRYVTYVTKRDDALKENPRAGSLEESVMGETIKDLFPKCQALAAKFEKTWGPKPIDVDKISNALRAIDRAVSVCKEIKSRDNLASGQIAAKVADLEKAKLKATDLYPAIIKVATIDPDHGGKTYGAILDGCTEATKGKQADQAAAEDKFQQDQDEASRKQNAKVAKEQAAEKAAMKARNAKLRKKLKGDRVSVFDKMGEPDDYTGALGTAPVWSYDGGTYHDATLVPCTRTYKFKGNKLTSQSKKGPGC